MYPHSLPIGAHLTTPRLGYVHHGLYAGDGRVIHSPGFKSLFRRARIEEVSLEEFIQGRRWRMRDLPSSKAEGAKRVERARSRLGEDAYRFWTNNCEHFVSWCMSGKRRSAQVERFKAQVLGILTLFLGLVVAGCASSAGPAPAGSVRAAPAVERWWPHFGDAAALERRVALSAFNQTEQEPF